MLKKTIVIALISFLVFQPILVQCVYANSAGSIDAVNMVLRNTTVQNGYRILPSQLKTLMDANVNPVIIDIRSAKSFKAGHIDGVIHIPLWSLVEKMEKDSMMLPKDQPIYVICCVKDIYSAYAVATLRMGGYDAYTIPGGIPQWIELGYPYVKDATEEVIKDDRQHPQTYIPKVEIMKQVDSFIQGIPQNHSYQLHLQDVKEQQDASIIDVRLDGQDAKELVPGARKIPLPILVEAIQNNPLLISKDKSVVVVDNLDTQAAFGVLALRLMGYQAYMISSQELL